MDRQEMRRVIEAVLFITDEPVASSELALLLETPIVEVESELEALAGFLADREGGVVLRRAAGGWQLATPPEAAPFLERFIAEARAPRLSQAALETLAIVAYRQPISRGQVAEIRGVSAEGVLRTLIGRGLVQEVGRDPGPGQAILYGTTSLFLERVGLNALKDLPPLADFMPDPVAVEKMEAGLGPGL